MLNFVFGVCVLHCFFCSHDVATVEGADEKEKGREGRGMKDHLKVKTRLQPGSGN